MAILCALRMFPEGDWVARLGRLEEAHPLLGALVQDALDGQDAVSRISWEIADWLEGEALDTTIGKCGLVHFFEPFLGRYDEALRRRRGVYYTPRPLAAFMVRGLDELLRNELGLPMGLASRATWSEVLRSHPSLVLPSGCSPDSSFVRILDPSTGTGTFLLEVISRIRATWVAEYGEGPEAQQAWTEYCFEQLLPNLHGRELMPAPLWICELQIVAALMATGLEPRRCARALHFERANTLADEELIGDGFTVILGNPPYSGLSQNMAPRFSEQVRPYYHCDGQRINERKTWLQDDYVKFIRFAERCLERTGVGVTSMVTPHSFLDTPTFRGMRQCLLRTYQGIWVLDLHGNSLRGERAEDGSPDPNLFGIRQGIGVHFMLRDSGVPRCAHASLFAPVGRAAGRTFKLRWLSEHSWASVPWESLRPGATPFHFLYPLDAAAWDEYQGFMSITDVMPVHCTGIVTARDGLVVDEDPSTLLERINDFRSSEHTDDVIRKRYFSGKGSKKYPPGDSRGWKLPQARAKLAADSAWQSRLRPCLYRPFDVRHLYYTPWMVDWPRVRVMEQLEVPGNRMLITVRQVSQRGGDWSHVAVSDQLVESCAISNKTREINYCFPMWVRDESGRITPNFSPKFIAAVEEQVGPCEPIDLYSYLVALLTSSAYRSRYADFLRFSFPRIAIPRERSLYMALVGLGERAVAAYVDHHRRRALVTRGAMLVERPRYEERRILLGAGGEILGIDQEVWDYRVGAYAACAKWLNDRRGRTLTAQDLLNFGGVVSRIESLVAIRREVDTRLEPGDFVADGRLHVA